MKELNEVEKLFAMEVLDTHGEYIMDLMQESITDKNLRITDELIDSLNYKVQQRGNDYVLSVSFMSYGRAIEIALFKSKRLRREAKAGKNEIKNLRRAKLKDTRFYTKNVYGSINRLLGRMSSEYSDAEIARLKGILENRMTNPLTP
jgi:sporulation protein YlmC with PRC-barrel domain